MSAQVTEAHRELARTIRLHLTLGQAYQLIADSEAKAVAGVNASLDAAIIRAWGISAERDQLRADRYYNRKCINRLASATGTLGEKSEKVVEVALSTIDQLRAEAAQTVALANWNGVLERALKAEAERDHLHAQLRALTLICGTNDANKFETWIDRANARAERAEAELAAERARVVDLVADLNDACITLASAAEDCDDYAMQNTGFKLTAVREVLLQHIPNAAMKEGA